MNLTNPRAVPDELDLFQPPNNVAGWSENVLMWLHDNTAGLRLYAHLSLISSTPRLFEAVIIVTTEDGRQFVNRNIGRYDDPTRGGTDSMTISCLNPGRRWRLQFRGVAQQTSALEMSQGYEFADARVPLDIDVAFDALHPMWSMGEDAKTEVIGHAHLEQGGRFVGSIHYGIERGWIDCFGLRDHSYGPRDYSNLEGFFWATCVFPSKQTLMLMKLWMGGRVVSRGYLGTADKVEEIKPLETPTLDNTLGEPRVFKLSFQSANGIQQVSCAVKDSFMMHLLKPLGNVFGYRKIDDTSCVDCHCPTEFVWNKDVGYGWIDRIRRVEHFLH